MRANLEMRTRQRADHPELGNTSTVLRTRIQDKKILGHKRCTGAYLHGVVAAVLPPTHERNELHCFRPSASRHSLIRRGTLVVFSSCPAALNNNSNY